MTLFSEIIFRFEPLSTSIHYLISDSSCRPKLESSNFSSEILFKTAPARETSSSREPPSQDIDFNMNYPPCYTCTPVTPQNSKEEQKWKTKAGGMGR